MIFGLVLSVVLTGALATYLASYIQKHLWIAYVGLVFILLVALQLVIGGLVDLDILSINEKFRRKSARVYKRGCLGRKQGRYYLLVRQNTRIHENGR